MGINLVETARELPMLALVRPFLISFATVLFALGCKNDQPPVNVTPPPPRETAASTQLAQPVQEIPRAQEGHPQPKLQTLKLWVGTNELTAELALTLPQIMSGMMWRTNMGEMDGMLFVFNKPHQAQFWMRNTLLPLSCAYIDPEGTILELHDMKPRDESPIPAGSDQVQYVLEVNQGWFDRHKVTPGMLVSTERGPLAKTFIHR